MHFVCTHKKIKSEAYCYFKFVTFVKTGGTLGKLGWVVSHDSRNLLPRYRSLLPDMNSLFLSEG